MKQTPKQAQATTVQLKSLTSQFAVLRRKMGTPNEVERFNAIRVKIGLKPVKVH